VGKVLRAQFGAAIREARDKAGLSQSEVAEAMNVRQTYVSKMELGQVNLSIDRLVELAAALGLEVTIHVHPRRVSLPD
jgi:transcriptional regulator with XRE-family HTH domain